MRFSRLVFSKYSPGHIWPWGKAGNEIKVGDGAVIKIESHQHGFYVVTAIRDGKQMQVAVQGEGHALSCDDQPQCEECGQFFQNAAGLANHVKSHITPVKQSTEKHA
jgi:hypothetical protein